MSFLDIPAENSLVSSANKGRVKKSERESKIRIFILLVLPSIFETVNPEQLSTISEMGLSFPMGARQKRTKFDKIRFQRDPSKNWDKEIRDEILAYTEVGKRKKVRSFMFTLLQSRLGRFRILAFLEGVSFLTILFVTMPLKYLYQNPEPNKIVGLVHGLLFLLYLIELFQVKVELEWKLKKTFLAALASVIPFGTFWAEKYLYLKTDEDDVKNQN